MFDSKNNFIPSIHLQFNIFYCPPIPLLNTHTKIKVKMWNGQIKSPPSTCKQRWKRKRPAKKDSLNANKIPSARQAAQNSHISLLSARKYPSVIYGFVHFEKIMFSSVDGETSQISFTYICWRSERKMSKNI